MSNASRIRRALRGGAETHEETLIRWRVIDFSLEPTLLGETLSDLHKIHALLAAIDLLDKRLQVTDAEHCCVADSARWRKSSAGSFVVMRK